jgi:hypothetical protein
MIETLGDAYDYGWKLTIRCAFGKRSGMRSVPECKLSVDIDLDTLIWTRGRQFPLDSLGRYFKCPRCGSRQVRVLWNVPPGAVPVRMRRGV